MTDTAATRPDTGEPHPRSASFGHLLLRALDVPAARREATAGRQKWKRE